MHRGIAFSVLLLGVFASAARAEHASASAFKAPVSTMSDTTRVSSAPRSPSLAMPRAATARGAMSNSGSLGTTSNANTNAIGGKSNNLTGPSGSSSSSSAPSYKPNEQAQSAMSSSGQKTREGISKLGQEATTTYTSMTNNFLNSVSNRTQSEDYPSLGALSGQVGSTAGSGSTKGGFDSLIQEKTNLFATQTEILKQIGARQMATVPPPVPPPPAPTVTVQERLAASLKGGRPQSGDPMSNLPQGFEAKGKGDSTSLKAIGTR